jgi:LysR family nitrogen assimilation transcriptional regulator
VYVAQPALSAQIAELEAELGVTLLHRSPRGVRPTAAGEAFYRESLEILRRVEQIPAMVRGSDGAIVGAVSLGMSSTMASVLAGAIMKACRENLPRVALTFVADDSVSLRARIDAHTLDLAVIYENEPIPGLMRTPLFRQDYFLIERDDGKRHGRAVTLEDIAALPLLLPPRSNSARVMIDRAFESAGLVPNAVAETNVFSSVVPAVQAGLGATLLPLGDFAGLFGVEGLVATPIHPPLVQTASLVFSESISLSRAGEAVHRFLAEYIPRFANEKNPPGMRVVAS